MLSNQTAELLQELLRLIFSAGAISVLGIFISKSLLLEPVRKIADRKYPRSIGYALKCAFCTIGWMSMLAPYKPRLLERLFDGNAVHSGIGVLGTLSYLVNSAALWWLATLCYQHTWPFLEKNAPKMHLNWTKRH